MIASAISCRSAVVFGVASVDLSRRSNYQGTGDSPLYRSQSTATRKSACSVTKHQRRTPVATQAVPMASDSVSTNMDWSARPGGILVYGATGEPKPAHCAHLATVFPASRSTAWNVRCATIFSRKPHCSSTTLCVMDRRLRADWEAHRAANQRARPSRHSVRPKP